MIKVTYYLTTRPVIWSVYFVLALKTDEYPTAMIFKVTKTGENFRILVI